MSREHVNMQDTLARKHAKDVSTQGTLPHEHVSMQDNLARDHVGTKSTLAHEHVRHAI